MKHTPVLLTGVQVADKVNVGSYFSMEKAMKIW
jgi:hypothetical protein